jgi:hypothetical protein
MRDRDTLAPSAKALRDDSAVIHGVWGSDLDVRSRHHRLVITITRASG